MTFSDKIAMVQMRLWGVTVGLMVTWMLLGPLPYLGVHTLMEIWEGPDLNARYKWKFGVLGYAHLRSWYHNRQMVETRAKWVSVTAFTWSIALCAGFWLLGRYWLHRCRIRNKT